MGNFYANIALRTDDAEAVGAAVAELDRTAFVATVRGTSVVFDAQCDEQDLLELERLAGALSKRLGCAALAVCNHDDDVLWYALAEAGRIVDRYDSNPGYFDGEGATSPSGGDALTLSKAFGVPHQRAALESLLRQPHSDVGVEVERHEALRKRLDLPEGLSLLGYRYVERGELPDDPEVILRAIGTAKPPNPTSSPSTQSPAAAPAMDEKTRMAIEAEGQELFWNSCALALAEAEVPERFLPIVGVRRGNGHLLLGHVMRYIKSHNLSVRGGLIRADELLAEFLGEREFAVFALTRLVRVALHIPPLSAEQIAAFQRGDVSLLQRAAEAIRLAQSQDEP